MLAPTRWRVRRPGAAVVAVVALVLALAVVTADRWNKEKSMPIQGSVASAITAEDLTAVAHARVFFGHQSVGMNMLNALPGIYADHGVSAPRSSSGAPRPLPTAGSSPTNSSARTPSRCSKSKTSTARCAMGWVGRSTSLS